LAVGEIAGTNSAGALTIGSVTIANGIVRLKFEGGVNPNSYFILDSLILQLLENQRTALAIQL